MKLGVTVGSANTTTSTIIPDKYYNCPIHKLQNEIAYDALAALEPV